MNQLLNLDKVYSSDQSYPWIINLLLNVFKYDKDIIRIKNNEYESYIDKTYSDPNFDKYNIEDLWFEQGVSIFVIRNNIENTIEEVFISHDSLDKKYKVPKHLWVLFDKAKELQFITNSVEYQYKHYYKQLINKSAGEADKIKYEMIELAYKKLSPKFETLLSFDLRIDGNFIHIVPVFKFIEGIIEGHTNELPIRISSVNVFLSKLYQMENVVRSINYIKE